MAPVTEAPAAPGNIMIVDDKPANLKLLEDMLRRHRHEVRVFPRGRLALKAAQEQPPDLILLDVNMPEINGYEVCERLKAQPSLSDIPVLFLSALTGIEDKVKAFRSGGADFISKPFQFEEVQARVETHLKLRRAQQAERKLLELTFSGAIRMLTELLHANSPELSARSRAVGDCVAWMTQRMGVVDPWQYHLAATLCFVGCVTLPDEVFRAAYAGQSVSAEGAAMFRAHPETAANLLINIPRLEPVAEMIRLQQSPEAQDPHTSTEIRFGARLLFLAIELDRRLYRGVPLGTAINQIKSNQAVLDPDMLNAFEKYSPAAPEYLHQAKPIRHLFAGMILDEDVVGVRTKILILRKGTVLTDIWIERLGNFAKYHGIVEPLPVLVPHSAKLHREIQVKG